MATQHHTVLRKAIAERVKSRALELHGGFGSHSHHTQCCTSSSSKIGISRAWWRMLGTAALGRQRQEACQELKASLGHMVSLSARTT